MVQNMLYLYFFSDIAKIPSINVLVVFYRKVYALFGSGSYQAPFAIFRKHAQHHNKGKTIGLIRPADTRMAGYIIAFLRLLRLKGAMESILLDPSFLRLKVASDMKKITSILHNSDFWKALLCITTGTFAPLRLLRLANQKVPAMDKLHFFVLKTAAMVEKMSGKIDSGMSGTAW